MLPLYDEFRDYATEDGKIMGHYEVLSFPTQGEVQQAYKRPAPVSYEPSYEPVEPNPYQKANFR